MIINGCWIKRLIWPVRYSMSAWKRNTFPSPNCRGWKGECAVHTGRESSGFFGVCWPCKTCMVISVKSRKILTCIDLHHTASLNGGLDGCSSILKAQYSQSTAKIFGKEIVSKSDCWNCSEKMCHERRVICTWCAFDCMSTTSIIQPHKTSVYSCLQWGDDVFLSFEVSCCRTTS